MAAQPQVRPDPTPPTNAPPAPSAVTPAQGNEAIRGPENAQLRGQIRVFGTVNGFGSDLNNPALWRGMPAEVVQAMLEGKQEAAKVFFRSWAESIARNGRLDRKASEKSLETARQVGLQAFNAYLQQHR